MNFKTILFSLLLISKSALAYQIELEIFGTSQEPRYEDLQQVNALLGGFLAQGGLKKFEITLRGREGGFVACVIPASHTDDLVYNALSSVKVDKKQTHFVLKKLKKCPD